jgi:hypothetical protein
MSSDVSILSLFVTANSEVARAINEVMASGMTAKINRIAPTVMAAAFFVTNSPKATASQK